MKIGTESRLVFAVIALVPLVCMANQADESEQRARPIDASDAGQAAPKSWSAVSSKGVYKVTIWPEAGALPIGQMHRWIIRITEVDGEPVYPARVSVGGGMQSHGHGLPTQPQLIAYGGRGEYLIDGVRFNMAGMWRLSFAIEAHLGTDRVDFDIPVEF